MDVQGLESKVVGVVLDIEFWEVDFDTEEGKPGEEAITQGQMAFGFE